MIKSGFKVGLLSTFLFVLILTSLPSIALAGKKVIEISYVDSHVLFQRAKKYRKKHVKVVGHKTQGGAFSMSYLDDSIFSTDKFARIGVVKAAGSSWEKLELVQNENVVIPMDMMENLHDYHFDKFNQKLESSSDGHAPLHTKEATFFVLPYKRFKKIFGSSEVIYLPTKSPVVILYDLQLRDGTKITSKMLKF